MRMRTILSAGVIVLTVTLPVEAQKPVSQGKLSAATPNKLIALKVTGSQRYTETEVLPAAGLSLGQNVTEADFKEGGRRLGNTGLFSEVGYSFTYSSAGTKVEFQLTDVEDSKLVPAHFENFVWFTDDELRAEIRRRVPLFRVRMPASGSMPDEVEQALQGAIDAKRVPARVDYLREAPANGGELIGIAYRVEAIEINIEKVEFPGATPDQMPGLQAAARKLTGAPYKRSPLASVAAIEFLPICLQRGYLKASFGEAQARITSQTDTEVLVDAIIPVTPGKVYSTSAVTWTGNRVLAVADLQKVIHLAEGQPADAVRLQADLETAAKLYRVKGYMLARIVPQAVLDDERGSVRYEMNVSEGDQFKMGELEILGLDSQARARLEAVWKLREGDPYDGEYPRHFLDESSRLAPSGVPWRVGIHEAVNEKDRTVDVTIRFSPN